MRKTIFGFVHAVAGAVVTGCLGEADEPINGAERAIKPPLASETKTALHHLSEGSELISCAMFRAVRVKSEFLEGFGAAAARSVIVR